ncbi:hypothetical protein [Kumtagia ephedrae]|nr:hypothetical protein [Mesorhizobium ephedrae]
MIYSKSFDLIGRKEAVSGAGTGPDVGSAGVEVAVLAGDMIYR